MKLLCYTQFQQYISRDITFGGPGSGCTGPNCGRPAMYHGTLWQNAESIMKKGLRNDVVKSYGGGWLNHKNMVYVTPKQDSAKQYGSLSGKKAIVFKLDLPETVHNQLKTDPNAKEVGSQAKMYKGSIAPEHIVGYQVSDGEGKNWSELKSISELPNEIQDNPLLAKPVDVAQQYMFRGFTYNWDPQVGKNGGYTAQPDERGLHPAGRAPNSVTLEQVRNGTTRYNVDGKSNGYGTWTPVHSAGETPNLGSTIAVPKTNTNISTPLNVPLTQKTEPITVPTQKVMAPQLTVTKPVSNNPDDKPSYVHKKTGAVWNYNPATGNYHQQGGDQQLSPQFISTQKVFKQT